MIFTAPLLVLRGFRVGTPQKVVAWGETLLWTLALGAACNAPPEEERAAQRQEADQHRVFWALGGLLGPLGGIVSGSGSARSVFGGADANDNGAKP